MPYFRAGSRLIAGKKIPKWNLVAQVLFPVFAEGFESRQRLSIFGTAGSFLAGDNVVRMADGKPFYVNTTFPGFRKMFNPIGRKDQIEIEGAILELYEILAGC